MVWRAALVQMSQILSCAVSCESFALRSVSIPSLRKFVCRACTCCMEIVISSMCVPHRMFNPGWREASLTHRIGKEWSESKITYQNLPMPY